MPGSESKLTFNKNAHLRPGDNSASYLSSTTGGHASLTPTNTLVHHNRPSFVSRFDFVSTPDFSIIPSGDIDVIFGNSGFPVSASTTVYIGAVVDSASSAVEIPLSARTISSLVVACSVAPGGGSYTYTVLKNGTPTSITCSITGSGVSSSSANSVVFSAGDKFCVKLVTSGGQESYHSYSVEVT